jgi:hypothetical protein
VSECKTSDIQEPNNGITQEMTVFPIYISQLLSVLLCILCDVCNKFWSVFCKWTFRFQCINSKYLVEGTLHRSWSILNILVIKISSTSMRNLVPITPTYCALLFHLIVLWKLTISFVMSLCPSIHSHGGAWLPLDGFSLNLNFKYFSKTCWENWSFIKIWQE